MSELTIEDWAQIRYAYEHTGRPIEDICREYGVSSATLRDRMRRWEWNRRRPPIPREGPPALPAPLPASPPPSREANGGAGVGGLCEAETNEEPPPTPLRLADASRSDAPHRLAGGGMEQESDAASIVPRLQSAVARVLPAVEATIARLTAGAHHPRELEQAGRALGALMRTLRELNALLSEQQARAKAAAEDDDPVPKNVDEYRLELARRIRAFVAARQAAQAANTDDEANADDEAKDGET